MTKSKKKAKKLNKKKLLGLIFCLILLVIIGVGIYYFLTVEDEDSSLTLIDKQWIDNNKTTLVDIEVPNNIGIIADSGTGVVFDFLDKFENVTGLSFNKISYSYPSYNNKNNQLAIAVVRNNEKIRSNDILIVDDNYVLLGLTDVYINDLSSLNNKTIGILSEDKDIVNSKVLPNSSFKEANDINSLKALLTTNKVNYIILPRYTYFKDIINSKDLHVNYSLNNISNKIVLRAGKTEKLNSIVSKILKIWLKDDYNVDFSKTLMKYYTKQEDVTSLNISKLTSKVYKYGYIKNTAYNLEKNNNLYGVSGEYINTLVKMANMEFEYVPYDNNNELKQALDNGKIDIAFINFSYSNDNYLNTVSSFNPKIVALSKTYKNLDNKDSLINNKLYLKNNNLLYDYVKNNISTNIKVINNYSDDISNDGILLVDENDYLYLKDTSFGSYNYLFKDSFAGNYHFTIKDNNKDLYSLTNFVLNNVDYNNHKDFALNNLISSSSNDSSFKQVYIIILAIIFIPIILVILSVIVIKSTKKLRISRKEEFLRYNDMLTNLKNRNYLNANIDKWDDTKIYPRTIIMIDLNNLKYVNDNYGHEEGNALIKKAAAILINTQLEKSDIVRTDGNEFLIYLIGYSKSQISTYISKLSKEFEGLPHGFGAAIGYSMIDDEIKTIDDAINEATIAMREDKENYK